MQALFSLNSIISSIVTFMSVKQYGINFLDILIIGVILFYSYEGYMLGLGLASLDFLSFILSFLLGLLFFDTVSRWIVALFSIPQGFANAIGFFLIALVSEVVLAILSRKLLNRIPIFQIKTS